MKEFIEPTYYALIPANVRYDNDLCANAKLLYGEITALTNQNGSCWAGNKYFADLYGTSKNTISRWIKQLKDKDYIQIKIFYKENSKEIENRIISITNTFITDKNESIDLLTKMSIPYIQNNHRPIDKNVKDNNTSINNIISHFLEKNAFPKINKLTDSRKRKLTLRIKEYGEDAIIKAIDIAAENSFLTGHNNKNWKMDLDWLISNDNNISKILEGKYSYTNREKIEDNLYGQRLN